MIDYIITFHDLVLSTYVLDELKDVVKRKFPNKCNELDEFLSTLSFSLAYTPQYAPKGLFEIRDAYDYPVLYTAIIEGIDILITGDKDFEDVLIEKPSIMKIAGFVAKYM